MSLQETIQATENRNAVDTKAIEQVIRESGDEKHQLMIFAMVYLGRRGLPYGRWTTQDGHQILFNREYQPLMWKHAINQDNVHAEKDSWVHDIVKEEFFWDDNSNPIDYLTRKVSSTELTEERKAACQKSLLICLALLQEYAPPRTVSESPSWSLSK